jgi:hypothetical protein
MVKASFRRKIWACCPTKLGHTPRRTHRMLPQKLSAWGLGHGRDHQRGRRSRKRGLAGWPAWRIDKLRKVRRLPPVQCQAGNTAETVGLWSSDILLVRFGTGLHRPSERFPPSEHLAPRRKRRPDSSLRVAELFSLRVKESLNDIESRHGQGQFAFGMRSNVGDCG